MSSPESRSAKDYEANADAEAKRRKIRKGTYSCWECKRRKLRCIRDPPTAAICTGCQRRGIKCVSQDLPEEISTPLDRALQMGDRVMRVEALVEQMRKEFGSESTTATTSEGGITPAHSTPSHLSIGTEPTRLLVLPKASEDGDALEDALPEGCTEFYKLQAVTQPATTPGKYEKLSLALHQSLPSREDTQRICNAHGHLSVLLNQILTIPYKTLEQDGLASTKSLLETPGPKSHPVLMARYMLQLALFLQQTHPDFHKETRGLSEPSPVIMKRLADTAISLVTTNDELLGSVEGLECVMMENAYHANCGNLRRSWMACRRAMAIAQLMGFHRPCNQVQYKALDSKTRAHPKFLWFRIVDCDRHLCLMLGFTQGTLDRSMASDTMLTNDTPMGRLERLHCAIAARILERNESASSTDDLALTRALDVELQKASRFMPSKWWLTPNLAGIADDPQALFWETRRLMNQLFHYSLLNQLHLPHMLHSSTDPKHDYSKVICVNASREILSRFIVFRSFNRIAFCYRAADFFALMAAMTLLLAHLDSHRRCSSHGGDLLAHQCYSDRAIIEQALHNMEEVGRRNADSLSAKSADLLRRLLAIEADAVDGSPLRAESVSVQHPGTAAPAQLDEVSNHIVRVYIPYFGIITIAREGVSSREVTSGQIPLYARNGHTRGPLPFSIGTSLAGAAELSSDSGVAIPPMEASQGGLEDDSAVLQPGSDGYAKGQAPLVGDHGFDHQFSAVEFDPLLQQYQYPGLTAGVDDWAFQGVDMAFFGNLMRGTGENGNGGSEWASWPDGS